MESYLVQDNKRILRVTRDINEARSLADINNEFYSIRKDVADFAETLMSLGISSRYVPRN